MKELNNFREFLVEGQVNENVSPEALMKVYQDEIKDAKENEQDDEVPAYEKGIEMLKKGGKPEEVNDKVQGLIIKLTGERGDPSVFLNKARKLTVQENDLHEGTWSLGSVAEMLKALALLEKLRKMGGVKGSLELDKLDNMLYNVFGDDSFHDAIDRAKADATDDDRFANAIGDAQARAMELYKDEVEYRKERGETGMEFKPRFGLEENDTALEEVSESMGIFKEIDEMVGRIKEQMDPDDAFNSLVSEFEAISGGTKLLHRALMNISLDNNL